MFKRVFNNVWAFDCEWAPDPDAGRRIYGCSSSASDREVVEEMWTHAGASDEDPQPFVKTVYSRILSIVCVRRTVKEGSNVELTMGCLPKDAKDPAETDERRILDVFFASAGKYRPQLVGFSSIDADMRILIQRGVLKGISAKAFCARPEKPWEGVDYFSRGGDEHVDLKTLLCGWGKTSGSLNDFCALSGIPGKMDAKGEMVADMWLSGRLQEIINYNQCDSLSTYLLWLRVAHFGGHFSAEELDIEEGRVRTLIGTMTEGGANPHLKAYLETWERLRQ